MHYRVWVVSSHRLEAACRWVWAGPSHRRYPLRIHESSSLTERAALARRVPRCARSCARPVVFSDACRDYSYTPTHIPRLSARLDRRPQASGPPSTPAIGIVSWGCVIIASVPTTVTAYPSVSTLVSRRREARAIVAATAVHGPQSAPPCSGVQRSPCGCTRPTVRLASHWKCAHCFSILTVRPPVRWLVWPAGPPLGRADAAMRP